MTRPTRHHEDSDGRYKAAEFVKNIAEVLGLVIAGIWAGYVFYVKEYPHLERRLAVAPEIRWRRAGNLCVAEVGFDVENKSTLPVSVNGVDIAAFTFTPHTSRTDKAFIPRWRLQGERLSAPDAMCTPDTNCPLVGRYAGGASFHDTYEWSFKQDSSKWVYFSATVHADGVTLAPIGDVWEPICGSDHRKITTTTDRGGSVTSMAVTTTEDVDPPVKEAAEAAASHHQQ